MKEVRLLLTSGGWYWQSMSKGVSEVQEMFYILILGGGYMSCKTSVGCMCTEDFLKLDFNGWSVLQSFKSLKKW